VIQMRAVTSLITRTRVEGLVILLVAAGYLWEAQNVPDLFKMPGVPGPTAFPDLLGIVFGLTGLWFLISPDQLFRRQAAAARDEAEPRAGPAAPAAGFWRRLAGQWHFYAMWLVILAYLLLMPVLGFPAATAALLVGFLLLLGETRWRVVPGLALAVTLVIYLGFAWGLNVRLPLGVLEPLAKALAR
jgi:hypothetical protein